jgi:hypothetical protein
MRDFRKTQEAPEQSSGPARTRTFYGCAATGCPNAGSIDDRGESNPGRCFWHWQAPAADWPAITAKIRADRSMGNHGNVPTKPSKHVADMQAAMRGQPAGVVNANTGAAAL